MVHVSPPAVSPQVMPAPVVMMAPFKVKPAGSVSVIVAAATVGPFVMVAVMIQLNVPPLPSTPTMLSVLLSVSPGFTQPVKNT